MTGPRSSSLIIRNYSLLRTLALARHDFAGALERGRNALVLDPENARYHGLVGDAQIELGRYDEAIESYQEMVNRRPDFASFSRISYAESSMATPRVP